MLGGFFDSIYPVYLGQKLVTLGHVTFLPMAVLPLMLERRVPRPDSRFAPTRAEWRIGALHYLYFLPVGGALGFCLHAFKPHEIAPLVENRGHVSRLSVGDRSLRRVLLPRRAATVDRRLDGAIARPRWQSHRLVFGAVHLGFPRLPVSQLAMGAGGGHARMVLRARAQSGRQHRRQHGDARSGGGGVARVLGVTISDAFGVLVLRKITPARRGTAG